MARHDQSGFTTIQYVVATGLSLLLFVLSANLLVDLYERGTVRDALDEGVRAAIPAAAVPLACETRAREVVRAVAGGSLLRVDALSCARDGYEIVAIARISMRSWFPMLVPDWHITLRARATQER